MDPFCIHTVERLVNDVLDRVSRFRMSGTNEDNLPAHKQTFRRLL